MSNNKPQPKVSDELAYAVKVLIANRAHLQVVKREVEAYQSKILADHQWPYAPEWVDGWAKIGETLPAYISDPSSSYLLSDEHAQIYFELCDVAKKALGYDLPEGHCPKLVSEYLETQAEWAVIDAAEYLTGLNSHSDGLYGDNREKLIDLIIGLVVAYARENGQPFTTRDVLGLFGIAPETGRAATLAILKAKTETLDKSA